MAGMCVFCAASSPMDSKKQSWRNKRRALVSFFLFGFISLYLELLKHLQCFVDWTLEKVALVILESIEHPA